MIIPRFKRPVMPRNDRFGRFRALRATYRSCIHCGYSLRELRRRSLSPLYRLLFVKIAPTNRTSIRANNKTSILNTPRLLINNDIKRHTRTSVRKTTYDLLSLSRRTELASQVGEFFRPNLKSASRTIQRACRRTKRAECPDDLSA